MRRSPPLRFLLLLLAGWTGIRAASLAPGWWPSGEVGRAPSGDRSGPEAAASPKDAELVVRPSLRNVAAPLPRNNPVRSVAVPRRSRARPAAAQPVEAPPWPALAWQLPARTPTGRRTVVAAGEAGTSARRAAESRWSFAAWSLLRPGDAPALAPGGTLGGSQAGALARFRLNGDSARPLALVARLSSPLRRPAGAEAAVGIDWRPSRRAPVQILAERREGLGREGRSAFAVTLHGGVSDAPLAGLRIDAYAQAGIVGTRSRDPFGDGALRLSVPLGRVRLGAGAWAAAQPGLARLDLGPQAALRLPLAGRDVAVAADWRFRLAGGARPGSGPALTIAADF